MSTPQQATPTVPTLPADSERATRLAEAMTANPYSNRHGRPWTVEEVLGVALERGLHSLEQDYLTDGRS